MTAINRRRALSGTAAITVGLPVLAACGDSDATTATDTSTTPTDTADPDTETSSPTEDGETGGGSGGGEALASAADVPVGGCFVVAASKIVVTQPTEGEFKAFTAVCTHQGCVVESSSDGEIPCPCHDSRFSLEDGSPLSGPATNPLAEVGITVDGDSITLA
jgi:Rieske Fe-S protein